MTGSPFWDAAWIFLGGAVCLGLVFLGGAWWRDQLAETRRYEALRERQRARQLRPWERDLPGLGRRRDGDI